MIYVILVILSHTAVILLMRFTEVEQGNRYATTTFNYVICAIMSFLFLEDKTLFFNSSDGWFALGYALFNSIFVTVGMVFTRISINVNGTPISTTFNRLGVLLPTVLSIIFFHELPGWLQLIGIAIAMGSIIYVNSGKDNQENNHIKSFKWLILIFLGCGMIDFNTKVFEMLGNKELQGHYVFYSFVFSILVSLGMMLVKDRKFTKNDVLVGAITGIPNQLVLYFSMKAVNLLPAYLVFPANSAGIILCVNLVNALIFKEPLSGREKIATAMIAVALVLINI